MLWQDGGSTIYVSINLNSTWSLCLSFGLWVYLLYFTHALWKPGRLFKVVCEGLLQFLWLQPVNQEGYLLNMESEP